MKNTTDNKSNSGRFAYLIKNTGILTISSFSSKVLVFLLVPLYTNVLSREEYGTYDISITTIQLLLPILTLNIYDAVMRFFMDSKYDKKRVFSVGVKHLLISSTLFGVIVFLFSRFLHQSSMFAALVPYTGFIFLYYISNLLNQYFIQMAKGIERVREIAIAGVINTFVTVVLNVVLLLICRAGLKGFYLAYICGQLCSVVFILWKIKLSNFLPFSYDKSYEREMLRYSVPLILVSLGWWCNNVSDRYAVTILCGLALNGIYSVSYKIPSILTTFQQIFIQAWQISAVKEYLDSNRDSAFFYGRVFRIINFLMCFICMTLIVLNKPVASFYYGKAFYDAWEYVPFLLVSGVFNSASGILGPILSADMNSKSLGVSSLVGAGINVVLNIILILLIGVQGAAVATAVSSYSIYALRKHAVGEKIRIERYGIIMLSWLLILVQAAIAIYWENVFAELLLFLTFLFLSRDELVEVGVKMKTLIVKRETKGF